MTNGYYCCANCKHCLRHDVAWCACHDTETTMGAYCPQWEGKKMSRLEEVQTEIADLERMDNEAMPPDWRFESYPSGSRVVTMNSYTVTGEYGDSLPCSGISRHLTENRQVLCDCHPASARHWVGANHDDQEWQDLAYIAKLRNSAPSLYNLARTLAAEVDELRGKLDDVRMGIGCARGQRTTQYCAEAAQRDEVIAKLLAMLKPDKHRPSWEHDEYARACEIAGRME